MNSFDIFVLMLAVIFLIFGLLRGVVRGLFSLFALILGFAAAGRWYKEVAGILSAHINSSAMASLLSFLLIFAVVSLGLVLLGGLLKRFIHRADLDTVDRLLGAALGLAKGVFIAMAITVTLVFFLPKPPAFLLNSTLSPSLVMLGDLGLRVAPPDLRQLARKKNAAFLTQVAARPARLEVRGEKQK
jgi:membrane protein required for colicin V production